MAMTAGSGWSTQPNVTPLIDVLLTLLVIFMVITPVTPRGEDAMAPQLPKKVEPTPVNTIVVQVVRTDAGDTVLEINRESVNWQNIQARLTDIFKTRADRVMFVSADNSIPWQEVARVIGAGHVAGVDKISLMPRRAT